MSVTPPFYTGAYPLRCSCGLYAGQTCSRQPCSFPTTYSVTPVVRGCVCPPGANRDCESPTCPRKPTQTSTEYRP